ncbi:MAG: CbrC family protein [Verrucomicrobiaceae bacterium]|nr:CbrC family protein [Verrucomicrobiaceae bacterium]
MSLPEFRYHPDPRKTGSVEASETECLCCGTARGYIYTGPVFCEEEVRDEICPWCIADGSAHEKFDAEFTDSAGVTGYDRSIQVPQSVIEEVAFRTPGFTGWQQEHWLTCCGDAAAFLGHAGRAELEQTWPDAIPAVRAECGYDDDEWDGYFAAMHKDSGPTAYVFQCLHCQKLLAYSDCH